MASDPVFEVALIRCLNEIVQGYNAENFEESLLPVRWDIHNENNNKEYRNRKEFIQFLINSLGQYNDSVFYTPGPPSMGDVFVDTFTTHKDLLNHVVNLIRRKGYSIYVRDVSFLGFPAYRVYIPGMSEVLSLSYEEAWFITCDAPEFRKVLLQLKQASSRELRKLAYYMEYRFTRPYRTPVDYYGSIADIYLEKSSDLTSLPPRSLLVLIYLRLQDYKKAFEHLNQCMVEENPGDSEVSNGIKNETLKMYYSCLLFCLKFKLEGFSNPRIKENLLELYDKELVFEVMHYLDEPERVFDYYTLPRCGDCSCCPVQKECYYPQWESLEMNIAARQKTNPIHQEKLAELFG
jgi:ribosomal protein S12 methylthiotransferase accessory factor